MTFLARTGFFARIATVATLSLVTAAATSQGIGSLPQIMKPEFFSRDLLLFIEGLDLTDEQQAITEIHFEDYDREFQRGLDEMELSVTNVANSVEELGDDKSAIVTAVLAPIQDWARKRDVLGHQLVENVRIILDEQQQAAWTQFNRRLEREKLLPEGRLSGESTNIEHVIRDQAIQVAVDSPLAEAQLRWELALSEGLRARAAAVSQGFDLIEQIENPNASAADIQSRRVELQARIAIRDITDQSIEEMAGLLGQQGPAFRKEALKRGYGRIFRTTPVERLFKAAISNDAIAADPAVLAAVRDLFAEYQRELGEINLTLLDTTRTWEPELEEAKIENRARRLSGEPRLRPDDPTRSLYQERRELGVRYAQLLRDLLGDELFGQLDGASRFIPRARPVDGERADGGLRPGGLKASGGRVSDPNYLKGKKEGGKPRGGPGSVSSGRGDD